MAIYTNYGRYLKAKQFKESLQERGDVYMVFGIGNPRWDCAPDNENYQGQMPIALYNTSILLEGDAQTNQFYDDHVNAYYQDQLEVDNKYLLYNGEIVKETSTDSDPVPLSNGDKVYLSECKDILPVFPCIWQHYNNPVLLNFGTNGEVHQDDYHKYYITGDDGDYTIYDTNDFYTISIPSDIEGQQYFAELYLRGLASKLNIKHPVGLLGAVKCDISFVKDIGDDTSNSYVGSAKQFWYGDRYWEIVEPDETYVESYIGNKVNQEIYPHHLIITATVNPRCLCSELNIDQAIVPRQIAIYSRPLINNQHGANYYRVGENVFNFGQYNKSEWDSLSVTVPKLNFALPCKFKPNSSSGEIEYPGDPATDFRFILHDYIKGSVREDKHAIDRFGYVIGF